LRAADQDDEMEAYDDEEDEEEEEEEEEEKQQKRLDIPAKAQSRSTTNIALRNKDLPRVMTIRYQRKVFSDAWLAVLRLPLPTVTYKKVLLWLPGNVMPHMGIPVRLADFLTDSYRLGGISR
jgi:U3 small nucleolar RNA-associated protein 19